MKSILSQIQHNYYEILKIILFIIAITIVVWISPKERFFKYEIQAGKPWKHKDLIATFDFSIIKTEAELAEEKEIILKNFVPYFRFDEEVVPTVIRDVEDRFALEWALSDTNGRPQDSLRYIRFLKKTVNNILKKGIIRYNPILDGKDKSYRIRLIRGNEVRSVNLGQLHDIRSANAYAQKRVQMLKVADSISLKEIIIRSLVQNVIYEENKSNADREELLKQISPTSGLVQRGELIIATGELVTPEKVQVLTSLKTEYEKELGSSEAREFIFVGGVMLITLLFVIQFLYLWLYKRKYYNEMKNIVIILLSQVLLIVLGISVFNNFPQYDYLVPYAILPIILVAFLDGGTAIMVHLVTVMILGFHAPNSFEFFYAQFTAGLIAVFVVKDLSKRADLFRTSLFVFLTYIVIYVSMMFVQEGSFKSLSFKAISYLSGSSVLLLLAFPLIYIYEKVFGVITQLSLLELSNTNNPLLRELSLKAPGTFQHSLQVANLASEALYEIGGDALLARTGALYHDIGKMENPLFFVENQVPGYNPHDELTYEESARIIIGHVLSGIEMARKAKVPEQIIDFIRTHHGTRRVEYFYRLERKLNPGMEVDPSEFTYHGPIPFSRETAVVMMADSVEAASRSIPEPNEQNINDLVENIINAQMEGKQLLNANITMKEINTVKKVLKKKMLSIHHIRVAYPD
jgi:putative nucleotidyltransferase with HDIG domain